MRAGAALEESLQRLMERPPAELNPEPAAFLAHVAQRLPEVDVPTLLLWGSRDPVVPVRIGEELERTLPGARLEVLPQCGHMLPEEKPVEGLAIVRTFMGEAAT